MKKNKYFLRIFLKFHNLILFLSYKFWPSTHNNIHSGHLGRYIKCQNINIYIL